MRKFPLLIILLCAACGGATYTPPVFYVTPIERVIGADEAGQIVFDATATARVLATSNALATGTEQSARSTSTTAARLTQDSLMVEQTRSALQLTAGAGQALATNAAAVHTAEADQTAAAATPTAHALQVAVAATGTQIARQAETIVRRQVLDDQVAAARGWLLLGVGVLFLLALAAALVFGISDILSSLAAIKRAEATRAQAEAMQLWIMQYGGRLLQLRGVPDKAGYCWEEMQPAQIPAPALALSVAEPVDTNIHEVPVRTKSEITGSIPVGQEETPERLKVLHLLIQAVAISGPGASVIPSAPALGMHPQEWQDAIDLLKTGPGRVGYVVTSPGRPKSGALGRTRLVQPAYKTLGALLDGVKRGDALPLPAPPMPAPAPKNVQNVISE